MIPDSEYRDLWASMRPFKMPGIRESQFLVSNNHNTEFMMSDLELSGMSPLHIGSYTHPMVQLRFGAVAGYVIPYFTPDGRYLMDDKDFLQMWRIKLKHLTEYNRLPKYDQPPGEELLKKGLLASYPYLHPMSHRLEGSNVICAEGEKKTSSILRHLGIPAFGIGGCHMWRNPDGSGSVHPWITDFLRARDATTVTIVPDGDIFRYDICNAYGNFARALEADGFAVRILNPGDKIDDLLVSWGEEASSRFAAIEALDVNDLVQSPASLVKKYSLAFRPDSKDRPVVFQHTANVMRLMEAHPGFPKIWRNSDTSRVHVGEKLAEPSLTELEIANYFQYNLGFEKVSHKMIYTCVDAIARKNARSPMLEWIQEQEWDGVARLDEWMIRHWGMEDTPYTREVSAKWLLSACARMDKAGSKVDWMLIVVGAQGTGKTSMPSVLFRGHSLTLYGEHNDKDLHMLLHSALCIGFDELDSFGRKETSNLKAMITRTEDAFRPPYGASVEVFPRRFTLYGCGNRYEFLQHDPSGYRRYAVLEANRLLAFSELEAVLGQLWAEAWHRYSAGGERWWEILTASDEAEKHVVPNVLVEQIENYLTGLQSKHGNNVKDGVLYFTMNGLIQATAPNQANNPRFASEVAAILTKMGCVRSNNINPTTGIRQRHYAMSVH